MPAGQGKDAERFAAALEQGTPPDFAGDGDLARELQIAAMLRSRGAAFAPRPDERARAKQRLMAMLAEQNGPRSDGQGPAATPPVAATERTAPLGRLLEPTFPSAPGTPQDDVDPAAVTAQMPVIAPTDEWDATELTAAGTTVDADTDAETGAGAAGPRAGRRAGRHSMPAGMPSRPGAGPRRSQRPAGRGGLRRRTMMVSAAAVVMMVVLGTAGVIGSRDALPGDALYGVKRAAESAGLALTFDDAARAHRHLELAATRLAEMEQLAARNPQATPAPELYTAAIQEFDAATGQGSRMLLATGEASGGGAPLEELRVWASEQAARLAELRGMLPAPAALGADGSIKLLDRLLGRTEALELRSSCSEVTSGAVDDLGPLPAEGTCAPRPVDPTGTGEGTGATSGSSRPTGTGGSTTGPGSTDTTGTPTGTPDADNPGLLPDELAPDGSRIGGSTGGTQGGVPTTSPTTAPGAGGGGGLLPPITLPPLLPGLPGITIG